jgi:metallophosphoesterase superfamily enzyme
MFQWRLEVSVQVQLNDDVVLDGRRAVWLPKQGTLVLSDLFFGMGAARRRRPDPMPATPQIEVWERIFSLLDDYAPTQVALLGDLKPTQGTVEGDEAEELRTIFRKLKGGGRKVVQVVGHPDRSGGPALEGTGIQPVEQLRVGPHTLMHRRRIFVYPRHESGPGFWINGGVHPLFAVPSQGPQGEADWLRLPAFLYTGFALVMPPFVSYAQGFEVIQPDRLPRQAKAWSLLADRLSPLELADLPPTPEHLRTLTRPPRKGKDTTKAAE